MNHPLGRSPSPAAKPFREREPCQPPDGAQPGTAGHPAAQRPGAGPSSRAASEALLSALREEGWGPGAWSRFLARAALRSARQAACRWPALAEATALHAALACAARPRGRRWVAGSWLLAVTHLGMLEDRRTLGCANVLTLLRASLPALEDRLGPALPLIGLATDFLDGKIARATDTVTPFGRDADFLADAALWNWYATRHETSPALRVAAAAVWLLPVAAVAASSFASGAMTEVPRSPWIRPAAALEVILAARALRRALPSPRGSAGAAGARGPGCTPRRHPQPPWRGIRPRRGAFDPGQD